jgi:hypothetical protein
MACSPFVFLEDEFQILEDQYRTGPTLRLSDPAYSDPISSVVAGLKRLAQYQTK